MGDVRLGKGTTSVHRIHELNVSIRDAVSSDLPMFDRIDRIADLQFPPGRLPDEEEDVEEAEYLKAIEGGWLLVVTVEDAVVGYLWCVEHGDVLHLRQITVHPGQGRRGLGRALIAEMVHRAKHRGMSSITLTTFADIPWNAPFYRRVGFSMVDAPERYPHLRGALRHEQQLGMDQRVGMIMALDRS